MQRLQRDGWIHVRDDRSIVRSSEELAVASTLIQRHRILERWLTDGLGLDWGIEDEEAERLSTSIPDQLIDCIDEFLGRPRTCLRDNLVPGLESPYGELTVLANVDAGVPSWFEKSAEGSMVSLATTFAHVNAVSVVQETFPLEGVNSPNGYQYKGGNYGDIVFPVKPTGYSLIDQLFEASMSMSTFAGDALPTPSTFQISVENGSGVANQATTIAAGLTAKGYRVVATGDRTPTGPIPETMVWYGGTPPPHNADWKNPELEAAQSVMSQIEGPAIKGYKPSEVTPGALVTVQTGTGLTLKPSVATITPTVKTSTAAFTSTTVSRTMASYLVELAAS
jgi:hypothetical protein